MLMGSESSTWPFLVNALPGRITELLAGRCTRIFFDKNPALRIASVGSSFRQTKEPDNKILLSRVSKLPVTDGSLYCTNSDLFGAPSIATIFISYSPIHITACFGLYRPFSGEIHTAVFLKAIMPTTDPFLGYTVYIYIHISFVSFYVMYYFLFKI
jgi:hypothetical protein